MTHEHESLTLLTLPPQSLAYILDFGFTHTTLSWRLMLSVAALPALGQMWAMFHLPESPRWCVLRLVCSNL
jgi:hypothetical protein